MMVFYRVLALGRWGVSVAWITPKIDWDSTDRYNFADLNRVENNTEYVYDLLVLRGYISELLVFIKSGRSITYLEFYDSMNRIESNIEKLGDSFFLPDGWEPMNTNWVSGETPFDYQVANRLENNLYLLEDLLRRIPQLSTICGDPLSICGMSAVTAKIGGL